jgi:hypothetical protein
MGEAQLDLLERLLAQLDRYAGAISRSQLENDQKTTVEQPIVAANLAYGA